MESLDHRGPDGYNSRSGRTLQLPRRPRRSRGATYELIEPVSENSVYVEHLAEKGEGFHHTCIAYQTQEAIEEAKAELLSQGREMIQGGGADGAFAFYYFDFPELGGALELLWLAALPDPEMTVG